MKKELSLLSLSSPLAPLNLVTLLQDEQFDTHNCTGHYSSEDSRGDRLIIQVFVLQFRKWLFSPAVHRESDPQVCWPIPDV